MPEDQRTIAKATLVQKLRDARTMLKDEFLECLFALSSNSLFSIPLKVPSIAHHRYSILSDDEPRVGSDGSPNFATLNSLRFQFFASALQFNLMPEDQRTIAKATLVQKLRDARTMRI
nr:callose synthase 11-like [Ipomoea batatas]